MAYSQGCGSTSWIYAKEKVILERSSLWNKNYSTHSLLPYVPPESFTPHQPLPERPYSICRRSALCRLFTHMYPRERIWCRSFALLFCLARENFPMRSRHISCIQVIVCSSIAGKRTVIQLPTISGRFSGVTSMHRPLRPCMRSTKSVVAGLCSTQMI